jgi:hypothetical protein
MVLARISSRCGIPQCCQFMEGKVMRLRRRVAAVAIAVMSLLAFSPATASAHVGNYCGHGSGSAHIHAPLTNTTSKFIRHTTYVHQDGSRTHYHLYKIYYYSVGSSWTDYEWKRCD